ncbi:MAG: baseplate J/gp47 family protein [Chitinispirillaceae bacterium]|nr:baseplate J/gp47 family protein [Chitinispirillaceae bacterium]
MAETPFAMDFNTLLENHLTDFDSQFAGCDRSAGGGIYLLSAVNSSAIWGLYKRLDWIAKQLFVSQCDNEQLLVHGAEYGLTKLISEDFSAFRARVLNRMRNPPAGGNRTDWETWPKEVSYAHTGYTESARDVFVYENSRGNGTINVVVTSSRTQAQGGEQEPTAELLAAITAYLAIKRPMGIWDFLVIGATKKNQDITMTVTGPCDTVKTATDITAFMTSLNVGKPLYIDQLKSIAIVNGATSASVSEPAADVGVTTGPTVYERIWPGTVSVS